MLMAGLMFTIESPSGPPSLSEAARKLHVDQHDLDESFGVVLVDPKKHIYTVLVNEDAAGHVRAPGSSSVKGPYSNPGIGIYGPPESEKEQ
jgi:hypothetical protein